MFNTLSQLTISIGKEVVWVLFFLTELIVVIMAFVFNYHWKYYGLSGKGMLGVKSLYLIGTMVLMIFTYLLASTF